MSTCICLNRSANALNVPNGEDTCLVTLLRCHGRQYLVQVSRAADKASTVADLIARVNEAKARDRVKVDDEKKRDKGRMKKRKE